MVDDDRVLLYEAVGGNAEALSTLLQIHGPGARASIAGQIPRKWQSVLSEDDVMQQTYTDAFLDITSFAPDEDGSFPGWLRRLTQCNLRDAIRMLKAIKRGGRTHRVECDDPAKSAVAFMTMLTASGTSPSQGAAGKEAESLLSDALAKLPPSYRIVVERFDLKGHDMESVALELGRSVGATYMLRTRAHDRLRRILGVPGDFFTDGA